VLSGFVITRLVAQQPTPHGLFRPDLRDFYARRAGRILPLLALTCVVGAVMFLFPDPGRAYGYVIKNPQHPFTLSFWLSIPTFTFYWFKHLWPGAGADYGLHWDILWSLSIEEQFYFLYPFMLRKLGDRRKLKLFLLLVIFFPPLFQALHGFYFPRTQVPILGQLAPFAALATGCLLYLAVERFGPLLAKDKRAAMLTTLAGLALFLIAFLHQDYRADVLGHILVTPGITWGIFLLVLGGIHLDFLGARTLAPLAWPGVLCYGGYLLHPLMFYFLWPVLTGLNEWLAFFLLAGVTFTVAWLVYRIFEWPMNKKVRRWCGAS
jgi:peptidoglycan/LPS O-acetylase OafA/YrhL